MKKYIVGGFCRDKIMGLEPSDKDYVLVGCTESDIQYMLSQGFKQVGKDFPVLLSPYGDEHALARTERKISVGYNGFSVNTTNVTLEEDLYRRDLTINAIAYDQKNKTNIDPYGGIADIKNKILRHVSPAFAEDPLRVLRLARFKARFVDFKIHESTEALVQKMIASGELSTLVPERVIKEFDKAFKTSNPSVFLKTLNSMGILGNFIVGVITDAEYKLIDTIANSASVKNRPYFIWEVLLRNREVKFELPKNIQKFSTKMQNRNIIQGFRKLSSTEMVDALQLLGWTHGIDEEDLYRCTELMQLERLIDSETEEFIAKVFDRALSTVFPDINTMMHNGEIKPEEIKPLVRKLKAENIQKMF